MLVYFVRGYYPFRNADRFLRAYTAREKLLTLEDHKYQNILLHQIAAIVFIVLEIFFTTHALLKIGEYHRIGRVGVISLLPCVLHLA